MEGNLLRRNSSQETTIIKNRGGYMAHDALDCGIASLGFFNGEKCQKLGTLRCFVTILTITVVLQATSQTFFRICVKQLAINFDFNQQNTNWLLITNEISQAILAMLVTYWAERFHRAGWIGGLVIYQAIAGFFIIIPTLTHLSEHPDTLEAISSTNICTNKTNSKVLNEFTHLNLTYGLFFIYQILVGLGSIGTIVIGISYIDDNCEKSDSPALIGTIFSAKIWGTQLGIGLSAIMSAISFDWWVGWTILSPLIFIFGVCLAIFPRKLLRTMIKQAARRILRNSKTNIWNCQRPIRFLHSFTFMAILKRLIINKILILNVLALAFIHTAIINYYFKESEYLQARFLFPTSEENGILDEWTSRLLTYFLRPMIIGLSILITGLFITRVQPRARNLIIWNIVSAAIIFILFISFIFISCPSTEVIGLYKGKLTQPFCSRQCMCLSKILFSPVCPQKSTRTYLSPCYAGCTKESFANGIKVYDDCSCSQDTDLSIFNERSFDGACNNFKCQRMWITYQILTTLAITIFYTCLVGRIIIILRSSLPQDKSMALAFNVTIVGIITSILGKLGYDEISDKTCAYWAYNSQKCILHKSPLHGNLLIITSMILIFIAILIDVILTFYINNLDCYEENEIDDDFPEVLPLRTNVEPNINPVLNLKNNENLDINESIVTHSKENKLGLTSASDEISSINNISQVEAIIETPEEGIKDVNDEQREEITKYTDVIRKTNEKTNGLQHIAKQEFKAHETEL